jgi:histidyl-tRNA synthetase
VADNSKFVPPKGMRDWLPQETLLRQKLIRLIESHYQLYGFQPIDTPVMENIEVLMGKGGGDNEKLMFKVMKRGDELGKAFVKQNISYEEWLDEITGNVSDMGLRFDMTVPLARYYGNHTSELPKPFRCYHIGPVWRADRPQKGRFREFYQCDIDIVGGATDNCEVELLLATDRVLKALGVGSFVIRLSHKNLLPAILKNIGVPEEIIPKVAMAIDKLGKQTKESVFGEISGFVAYDILNKIVKFIEDAKAGTRELIPEVKSIDEQITSICDRVLAVNPNAKIFFDPLLVRGFDYYTGPVFEINVENPEFTLSVGGGGRYDGLIEKLGGPKNTPAVGLSLGFERILTILLEKEGAVAKSTYPRVYLVNDGQAEKDIQTLAESLRSHGIAVETGLEKKDKVKQLVAAQGSGLEYAITDFMPGAQTFKVRQLSNRQDIEMNAEQLKAALQKLL